MTVLGRFIAVVLGSTYGARKRPGSRGDRGERRVEYGGGKGESAARGPTARRGTEVRWKLSRDWCGTPSWMLRGRSETTPALRASQAGSCGVQSSRAHDACA